MEKARKKELLENFCCKEVIFAILCIIACVVLFFVRARFPAGTVIRAALGVVEANVGLLAILVLFLSAPPTRRWGGASSNPPSRARRRTWPRIRSPGSGWAGGAPW